MRSWAGIILGAVTLAVLDGIVSRPRAASNVGGWIAKAGNAVDWFLSPQVPAFGNSINASKVSGDVTNDATTPATTVPPASQVPALSPTGTSGVKAS